MHYEGNEKINTWFMIAIVAVVVIGIVGGICLGSALKTPTAAALEAMEDIIEHPNLALSMYYETTKETTWGGASVGAMLGTWCVTAVVTFLLFVKKCQLEMLDYIAGKLNNIEENTQQKETITEIE